MRILAISPFHDSSVTVYNDGKIEYFIKEERLSKIKRDKHPFLAVQEALKYAKGKIDLAVICAPDQDDTSINVWKHYLDKILNVEVIDLSAQHHLQHAALAFYNSGFDKALVVVIDRNGSRYGQYREAETVFLCEYPCKFKPIIKNFWRESESIDAELRDQLLQGFDDCLVNLGSRYGIVKTYETATSLINQHALENGKTMGLAAYGQNKKHMTLFHDRYIPNDYMFSHTMLYDEIAAINKSLHDISANEIRKDNFQPYADYALNVQLETETAAINLIEDALNISNLNNVCITGGYGLNVVANGKYLNRFPDTKFYFEPLSDDSGNSIGGAMLIYRDKTRDMQKNKLEHTFFSGKLHEIMVDGTDTSPEQIAQLLAIQKSVGIYYGLSEAGPRALGHRSILFDARNHNAKNIVNKIKKREWYRPFACIILKEDFENYFIGTDNYCNKFMTTSYTVRDNVRDKIPGVIHIDGTCRVQVVDHTDGFLYDILTKFKSLTGVSVLLNTSLNLAGLPLTETPQDALEVLQNSELDILYFPDKQIYVN